MGLGINDEHVALGASAAKFLQQHCPSEVRRAALEAPSETGPPFWADMAELGWFGLHLPEEVGGQGYGLAELAIVLEELGRAGAPGSFLPTVLAAALIARGGSPAVRQSTLSALASGSVSAAVAFPGTARLVASGALGNGTITVSGRARPVLGGCGADWLVLAAESPSGEVWCVMPAADVEVQELRSLDPTRRCAEVHAEVVSVPATHQLHLDGAAIEGLVVSLAAAECIGGAEWCLDTATEYAKVRQQFGRPIGQFQAVKHRCANMLVALEAARAATWEAVQALDGSTAWESSVALDAAAAATLAPKAFCGLAEDCIQVLGGIGFTWEHDAHLFLRRAITMRQLTGTSARWNRKVADLALAGARHRIQIDLPGDDDELRLAIRAEAESIAARPAGERRQKLVEAGLFVPHWAPPWGRDASPVEQLVIDQELKRARLRRPNLAVGAWAAPTIATHGTAAQQERWVGPTLLGQITWCQLFSEPGAGSDLASLSTRATATEGGWLLQGQKVWTSMAGEADWGICLARTNHRAAKHLGITYFVVDMRSAGIDIRPLRELTGNAMFNEVFLNDVFVPDDCVIGEVDGGWTLARTTLANERVAMGSGSSFGGGIESLLGLAGEMSPDLDPVALDHLGGLVAEAHAVALLGHRATLRAVSGRGPGAESSVRKLLAAEHDQRAQEFGLGLLGGEGATLEGAGEQWSFGFLANRCLTIAGGTSEVQRNVIAERLLGLPRDPEG